MTTSSRYILKGASHGAGPQQSKPAGAAGTSSSGVQGAAGGLQDEDRDEMDMADQEAKVVNMLEELFRARP